MLSSSVTSDEFLTKTFSRFSPCRYVRHQCMLLSHPKAYEISMKTRKTHFFEKSGEKIWRLHKNPLPLHSLLRHKACRSDNGEMVEWSITTVLKTVVLRGTGGSNPSLSATCKDANHICGSHFF